MVLTYPPLWWQTSFDPAWTVSLLPPSNSTPWELAVEAVDADLVARDPTDLVTISRSPVHVPSQWLRYLAAERSVDEFSSSWSDQRQRQVVAGSFQLHRSKGTRPALDRALAPLGYRPTVTEWFEVSSYRRPYTFRIIVDIDDDQEWIGGREEFIRVANHAKNAHTMLEVLELRRRTTPAAVYIGGLTRRSRTIRVGQLPKVETIHLPSILYVGVAQTRRRTLRIGPRP